MSTGLSPEQVAHYLSELGITLELHPEAVDTLAEVSVEEVMAEAAQYFIEGAMNLEPTLHSFGTTVVTEDEMRAFLSEVARTSFETGDTKTNRENKVVAVSFDLETEFDGSLELAQLFLASGLEGVLTNQAPDDETLFANLDTLERVRDQQPLRNDALAIQHIRRVLGHSKDIAQAITPHSSLSQETLRALHALSQEALTAPVLQLALMANGSHSVKGVLPLLPGQINSAEPLNEAVIVSPEEHQDLALALMEDATLASGLALNLLSEAGITQVVAAVNRVWGGILSEEAAETLALYLKDDTAG